MQPYDELFTEHVNALGWYADTYAKSLTKANTDC